ncbi:MAG: biopolymer transporter ExbD [Bacteroidales bacterium]|nr:biopolymer transporter ExbD [Bacteroidales bacterium]
MAIVSRNKRNISFAMSGMTDIVFLLLIFFMLTTTLIVPAAKQVELPESNNQTQASPVLVISITTDKTIYVEDQSYAMSELEPVLKKMLEPHGETPTIRLNADRSLAMEEVFSVLNIAKRNRYRVILGTKPVS